MNRQQKVFLAIFALFDVGVVLLLGSVALDYMGAPTATPDIIYVSPCAVELLSALPLTATPQVQWDESIVWVRLSGVESAPAERLWTTLNAITLTLAHPGCQLPSTVRLHLITPEAGISAHYIAEFYGPALTAWAQGRLSDALLAKQTRYRRITIPLK